MKSNNSNHSNMLISILVISVFVISLASFSVTMFKYAESKEKLTGYASGYVNLTISTQITLNISRDTINWGAGLLNTTASGYTNNATLYTSGETSTVNWGNWSTANAKAIIIQNLGTVNCSLKLQALTNASAMIGGTATVRAYQWNISNKQAGTCSDNGGEVRNVWKDVNNTQATYCNQMGHIITAREIYIDVKLVIPDDSFSGTKSDTITITGDTAV
jgi:hypothetical protein